MTEQEQMIVKLEAMMKDTLNDATFYNFWLDELLFILNINGGFEMVNKKLQALLKENLNTPVIYAVIQKQLRVR
jgi:hypothetical protein